MVCVVPPLLQIKKSEPGVPPLAVAVAVPLLPPKQETLVLVAVMDMLPALVTVTQADFVQLAASVTVTQ